MLRPTSLLLVAIAALAPACRSAAGPIDPGYAWVDLTYAFDETTIYWPTGSPFQHRQMHHGHTEGGYFYSSFDYGASEHGGTHMDAPIHFAEDRWTVDEIPIERMIGPVVVIDVRAECAADRDYTLTVEKIEAWEAAHGLIEAGCIVLMHTGWGQYWPDRKQYLGDDRPGKTDDLHFPAFNAASAQALVDRGVKMVGLDTASLDPGPSTDFAAHVVFNSANLPGLENVAHLERIPTRGAWLIALPMKIGKGSGGPTRIVALVPR